MLQKGGVYPMLGPAQVLHLFARYYDDPEDPEDLLDLVGPGRRPAHPVAAAVRRRAAAAVPGPGPGGEARGALPRRAHRRGRPRGPARRARHHRRPAGPGDLRILTTHELAEAERLADHVVIIDRGRMLAEGSPGRAGLGDGRRLRSASPPDRASTPAALAAALGAGRRRSPRSSRAPTGSARRRCLHARRWSPPWPAGWPSGTCPSATSAPASPSRRPTWPSPAPGEIRADAAGGGDRDRRADRGRRRSGRRGADRRRRPMRPLTAQLRAEVTMLFTNGETLFLTLGIPVVFLLFFSAVHVLPTGTQHPVDFLVPGILALAVMSTAMTALGHRHRVRARLRRAQAAGVHPARPAPPAGGQDHGHHRGGVGPGRRAGGGGLRPGLEPGRPRRGRGPGRRGRRRHGARHRRLRRHRPAAGRDPQAPGQPGRGQRALRGPAAARRHAHPPGQAAQRGWPTSPRCCRPRRWPTPSTAPSGTAPRCPPGTGSCWRSGRWPPRWWPASPSAGSEPADVSRPTGDQARSEPASRCSHRSSSAAVTGPDHVADDRARRRR